MNTLRTLLISTSKTRKIRFSKLALTELRRPVFVLMPLSFCLLITTASINAFAEIYKYEDSSGNIIYSDSPPPDQPNLAPADLPPVLFQPATVPRDRNSTSTLSSNESITVSIVTPEQDAYILPTQQSFNVTASLSRPLKGGEKATLFVNGKPYSSASSSINWSVENLTRGEYSLRVVIADSQNKTLSESQTTKIFVQRHIAR